MESPGAGLASTALGRDTSKEALFMSIHAITSGAAQLTANPANDLKSSGAASDKAGSSDGSGSSATVTSTVTTTNADGSTTTITTYANGTTSTTSTAPTTSASNSGSGSPTGSGSGSGSLLDRTNGGQLSTLLAAQENAIGS
jgi:hypothetical protein